MAYEEGRRSILALRSESGEPRGFARVVRDFSTRHSREKLRCGSVLLRERAEESTVLYQASFTMLRSE